MKPIVYAFITSIFFFKNQNQIKSSLYSPYYAEACNELRGPFPRLSAWATQLRRNAATVASRWRHCADLTGPGIEPQTSRTESVRFATELTAGYIFFYCLFILLSRESDHSAITSSLSCLPSVHHTKMGESRLPALLPTCETSKLAGLFSTLLL